MYVVDNSNEFSMEKVEATTACFIGAESSGGPEPWIQPLGKNSKQLNAVSSFLPN